MRVVVLSDIHSNLSALEAVLRTAGSYDELWCLGDTIGYGPWPNECADRMRTGARIAISGNHDLACLARIDLNDFNPDARRANIWNGDQLSDANRAWLGALPSIQPVDRTFMIVHGSPREPVWEYLLMPEQAMANFDRFSQQVCFVGHSHVQLGFRLRDGMDRCERFLPTDGETLELCPGLRYFINPGSVGQPRDQDPRAAFAVLDTTAGTITFRRVEYDIVSTQLQMRDAGLPAQLIRRLEFGM
jgi:diadenosine tetraphosphatase ApaH/serine/threonine PP2A family protein phosphatase